MTQRIKLLCVERDRERLAPILAALGEKGLKVEEGAPTKSDVVLAALSESFYADATAQETLLGLIGAGAENVLPLQLDEAPMPDALKNALYARNIIPAAGRDAKLIAERIVAALPKKKPILPLILSVAALLIAAAVGLFLWKQQQPPVSEEELVPAAATEEPEAPSIYIPEGMTAEDLAKVKIVTFVGEETYFETDETLEGYGFLPDWDSYANRVFNEDGAHWYSRADGHELQMTRYEDLRFLELMPNLQWLFLDFVEVDELPDLSGASKLTNVMIADCRISDLNWLAGSGIWNIHILNSTGTLTDFSPLSSCGALENVHIDLVGCSDADLSGFAPPKLKWLWLNNFQDLRSVDLTGLLQCAELDYVQIDGGSPITDLSFLANAAKLETLRLENLQSLRDISAVSNCKRLKDLVVNYCNVLRDFTPIGGCTALEQLEIHTDYSEVRLQDASFLADLPKLRDISLLGVELRDMNFLENYGDRELSLGFAGDIQDYSGLAYVKNYDYLHVNPRNNSGRSGRGGDISPILPYIQDATIDNLMLYACANVDLSTLPKVTGVLSICYGDLSDLHGLQAYPIRKIELRYCNYLRSLEGLEALPGLKGDRSPLDLVITGCPHLTDWSALEGSRLDQLTLKETYMLPDLGTIDMNRLRLESIVDLEDLSCLDAIGFDHDLDLELENLTQLRDLTPVFRLRGEHVLVPAHLAEQGRELIENGNYRELAVSYPEAGWQQDTSPIELLSFYELETLPRSVLKRVERVAIAEDGLLDLNRFEVVKRWEDGRQLPILRERETGEERPLGEGTIRDLSALENLSGLRELSLYAQPVDDLNGVQKLASLQRFTADFCTELHDVSPLFALQDLEQISLRYSGASSIQGIQNLSRLVRLDLSGTAVTDLSPLADCDFSYAMDCGGFDFSGNEIDIDDKGFDALGKIGRFSGIAFVDQDPAVWIPALRGCRIINFGAANDFRSNEDLAAFCEDHNELEGLYIGYNDRITDLTPLLRIESLRRVTVDGRMEAALASLDGQDFGFELEVQG